MSSWSLTNLAGPQSHRESRLVDVLRFPSIGRHPFKDGDSVCRYLLSCPLAVGGANLTLRGVSKEKKQ